LTQSHNQALLSGRFTQALSRVADVTLNVGRSNPDGSENKHKIAGLDGLRALAVLLVYFNHKTELGGLLGTGGHGVRIFFVLSGFLIIGILFRDRMKIEQETLRPASAFLRFYTNRIFRIWPLYYAVCGLVIGLSVFGLLEALDQLHLFSLLTMTLNIPIAYIWEDYPKGYGVLWSVAVEEQFYLIFAPLLLLVPSRFALRVCIGVVAFSAVFSVWSVVQQHPARALYVGPISNFGIMALGGIAALTPRLGLAARKWMGVLFIIVLVFPFSRAIFGPDSVVDQTIFWLLPVVSAFLIKAIAENQKTWVVRILDTFPLRWLGRVSFAFYILHDLMPGLDHIFGNFALLADFMIVLTVATLSWAAFEKPILERRKAVLDKIERRLGGRDVKTT
jgi:peptidoglycan/LPS O-acetylase OafA/YrhL